MIHFPINTQFGDGGCVQWCAYHTSQYAIVLDCPMCHMPKNQNVFWLSVAIMLIGLIMLILWPFLACSGGRCAYFECGLWITGRVLIHIFFISFVIIVGFIGAFVTVTGYLEYKTDMYWTGIALACVAGGALVIYLVTSLIIKIVPKCNRAKWCFEYNCESIALWKFNLAYGISTLFVIAVGCIIFGVNFTNNVQVSASHELLETIAIAWNDYMKWFEGNHLSEIADFFFVRLWLFSAF